MRIYSVTPIHVSDAELARRQARYDALCPQGLSVELHEIGSAAPRALETEQDVRASEALVAEALADAASRGYDALMPDCVLDPAVADLAGTLEVPVLGLLRLSVGWSVITGRTASAVARNRAIADEIEARVAAYGWTSAFTGVDVLDVDVHAIADATRWAEAMEGAVERLAAGGASLVVNGCSAVDLPAGVGRDAVVVDPTALALRLLAAGGLT
ncbi:MAG: aspartate/glutamate racemase family protein [Actinomycetota bacterium]